MGIKNDYRVSTIVVLCKDCNQDVGLYPARHQCDTTTKKPKLPTLYSSTLNSSWIQSPTEEQTYFDDQTSTLPSEKGKNLWGKLRENEKWNDLVQAEKKAQRQEKPSSKLWGKIINVTMSNNSLYDDCPESDDDDWEGETHVSRTLREYYESQRLPLPDWLLDDTKVDRSSRRLWQQQDNSSRQKEIMEIRLNDSLKNSNSSYTLYSQDKNENIKNSYSMPNVSEAFSNRKQSNFAHVTLSMNNSLRQLYPKRANTTTTKTTTSSSKHQYFSSTTTKSFF